MSRPAREVHLWKVFSGVYAAHVSVRGRADRSNNREATLAEAAFMTGLERNADVEVVTSYAPPFAHVDARRWTPKPIRFDNLHSFGTRRRYLPKL